MAGNSKSRKKTRDVKVAKPKTKVKPVKRPKRKPVPVQVPVQVGHPPADQTPPEIRDTRPTPIPVPTTQPAPAPTEMPPSSAGTVAPGKPVPAIPARGRQAPAPGVKGAGGGPLVQGASCTWIGPITATVEDSATGIPLCPYCGGRLVETSDEHTLQLGLEAWELGVYAAAGNKPARPHPGYRGLVAWMRNQGQCWPTIGHAALAYRDKTGMNVDPNE